MVQGDDGSDLIFQQHVDQVVVVSDSFLVDVFACRKDVSVIL